MFNIPNPNNKDLANTRIALVVEGLTLNIYSDALIGETISMDIVMDKLREQGPSVMASRLSGLGMGVAVAPEEMLPGHSQHPSLDSDESSPLRSTDAFCLRASSSSTFGVQHPEKITAEMKKFRGSMKDYLTKDYGFRPENVKTP